MRLHKDGESCLVVLIGGLLFVLSPFMFTNNALLLFVASFFWLTAFSGSFAYMFNRQHLELFSKKFKILFMESINKV